MKPFLSIITSTFNSQSTLRETIDSILNQNYTNFEFIIIDGNSTDRTIDIIQEYKSIFDKKNINFKWISENDSGIYNAWNKGLKIAKGDWISFLGSDDIYLDKALEKYAKVIEKNKDKDFIYSKVKLVSGNNIKYLITDQWNWRIFKRYMKISHVGSFHNKEYFQRFGYFDESFKISGDYEMLLRARENLKTAFIDAFTAEMKDGGISNKNVIKAFREVKKAKIKTAQTNFFIAYLDFYFSITKYYLSKIIKKV